MSEITGGGGGLRYSSSRGRFVRKRERGTRWGADVKQAIRMVQSHGLWLTLTYVGLLLLIARAYAG